MPPFRCVLIDEAGQATEPACLVPLMKGARSLVMCGDHFQLPATVISREAELGGLGVSLFERLARSGVTSYLLDTQFRSHPAIAMFPSNFFYNGRVKSAAMLSSETRPPPPGFEWPNPHNPVAFVAARSGQEMPSGSSYTNPTEVGLVAHIVGQVCHAAQGGAFQGAVSIGVIAPYAAQVRQLEQSLLLWLRRS